jgi:hypothetical protein
MPEPMSSQELILKRASASRPSGKWNEDDYDVLAGDVVVGRIMKAIAAPVGSPWFWTLAFGYHRDRRPTHGYAATREAAMAAFAKSWRRVKDRADEVDSAIVAFRCPKDLVGAIGRAHGSHARKGKDERLK